MRAVMGTSGPTPPVPPPPHDSFSSPQPVSDDGWPYRLEVRSATKERGEPAHAGGQGGASLWFEYTAAFDGYVAISTKDSSYDTLLGVYTGSSVSTLTPVAANDDYGAGVRFSRLDRLPSSNT